MPNLQKSPYRKISLRTKFILAIFFSLFLFASFAAGISYKVFMEITIEKNKQIVTGVAKLAASEINAERVDQYLTLGEKAEGYLAVRTRLYNIRNTTPNIKFIYVYKIEKDGCHVVFDLDSDDVEGEQPGNVIPFDASFAKYIPTLLYGGFIDPIITDDTYGWLLTAYIPVYDDEGVCQCYAAADISMDWLRVQSREYLYTLASIFLLVFMGILIVVLFLSNRYVINPINTMAIATSSFAYTDEDSMEKSLDEILNRNISTGDEIENLYISFTQMAINSVKYIKDIHQKNDAISQMQHTFIVTLADMVESRDINTGQHIRKTASYVEVIMNEMRKNSKYATMLTDQFIKDVKLSAPLHDIGKINVPDAILNKPGKLTNDEFEIMKTHTTKGGEIISKIMEQVSDPAYLQEAKILATYHHEKWNGKGYPLGLSGEEIPLSARIMAVADVFDALVSHRSYKKGFPYEKAFAIIREERGTHFDPEIVDAFFAVKDTVVKIADDFSKQERTGSEAA
ncbi:MAG: HD domain-containing protein [Desulfovibrio sp.]|nr:HD domain-containing protein [Desulfovibrio sp.]